MKAKIPEAHSIIHRKHLYEVYNKTFRIIYTVSLKIGTNRLYKAHQNLAFLKPPNGSFKF